MSSAPFKTAIICDLCSRVESLMNSAHERKSSGKRDVTEDNMRVKALTDLMCVKGYDRMVASE